MPTEVALTLTPSALATAHAPLAGDRQPEGVVQQQQQKKQRKGKRKGPAVAQAEAMPSQAEADDEAPDSSGNPAKQARPDLDRAMAEVLRCCLGTVSASAPSPHLCASPAQL